MGAVGNISRHQLLGKIAEYGNIVDNFLCENYCQR